MATGWRSSYYRYKELFLNISVLYKKRADLRAFLEIVLSIVAVIIFVMFALKPTALTIISLVQQIKEERKTLSILTKKVSDLQKANTLLVQNQRYIGNVNVAVSSAPAPDVFMKQVEGLSARNGVNLMGLVISDIVLVGSPRTIRISGELEPLPESANEMGYSISVRGGFSNIDNFIKELEKLRVISTIDSVTINSSVTESGRVIVAVISGRVPYLGSDK
jgi:ACT domain-containing protein